MVTERAGWHMDCRSENNFVSSLTPGGQKISTSVTHAKVVKYIFAMLLSLMPYVIQSPVIDYSFSWKKRKL